MLTIGAIRSRVRVEPSTGCWLWLGSTNDRGYPTANDGGRKVYVHREACARRHGPLPLGHEARHSPACESLDTHLEPHERRGRRCVNPDHLTPGTRSENARDRERARGRRLAPNRRVTSW